MSSSIVNILVNLRSVVGEVAFNAAVEAIQSGKVPLTAAPGEKVKKERKQVELAPEKAAERAANMAALQAWIAKVRSEMPEGTTFRDAQKAAGESWKAMSKEQLAAWKEAHPYKGAEEAEEGELVAEKPAKVVVVGAGATAAPKEPKQVVTVAKATVDKADEPAASESAPKKAGRPKKVVAEQKADE